MAVYLYKGVDVEKSFSEALEFRHACKLFDEEKKISKEDMLYILEAGRNSPSSFGQEGWKFLVITNDELKSKLRPYCWNQPQITTCSHLVVILTAIEALKPSSGIPQKRFQRRELPKERIEAYIKKYEEHLKEMGALDDERLLYEWGSKQCHIALANMMIAAAVKGIDSCAIEGFEKKEVEKVLGLDTKKFQLSLILPLGYRVKPQPKRIRLTPKEVYEWIV